METEIFSPEIEEKFLGLILRNSWSVDFDKITPEMFSSIQNKIIYSTILELETTREVDKNLLIEYLKGRNLLEKAGGVSYINHLYNIDYSIEDYEKYCNIIISSYKIRSLLSLARTLRRENLNIDTIDSELNRLIARLEELAILSKDDITQDFYTALKLSWKGIEEKLSKETPFGIPFGLENIDSVLGGIDRGDLWIIGARPSMGKTALMCNSALKTAKKGTKALILSLEMGRQAIIERLLAIETQIPVFNLRLGILDQKDVDKISSTIQEIKNLPIFINTKLIQDLNYIESIIRKRKSVDDIDIVYLDYIQLLTARDEDSTQELGRISQRLKSLAKDLKIGICALSQLSRDLEKRPNKRPVMSDLRQSGYLEEDADLVAFLYRDSVYNPATQFPNTMEFIIRKNRNGNIGTIPLTFEAETNRIY